jgi:hypothetical protein
LQPPGDELRRPDDQVQGKISRDALADFKGLAPPLAVERRRFKTDCPRLISLNSKCIVQP